LRVGELGKSIAIFFNYATRRGSAPIYGRCIKPCIPTDQQ
jgi:hypothetical protein